MCEKIEEVGEKGDLVLLRKKQFLPGFFSKIKPGNERRIVLKKPLKVGHVVVRLKFSTKGRSEGKEFGFQTTSQITGISPTEKINTFEMRTITSIYEVIFVQ